MIPSRQRTGAEETRTLTRQLDEASSQEGFLSLGFSVAETWFTVSNE
jgi:hypothetical protein